MILYASCKRTALEPISYGTLVRHDDEGCQTSNFDLMTGVAKRGNGHDRYLSGEEVLIQTDGEIRIELSEIIELVYQGVARRLLARQPVMVLLERGRIVNGW